MLGTVSKRTLFIGTVLLCSSLATPARAQPPGTFGVGAIIGEPTGLSGKYWLDGTKALDVGLSYSFDRPSLVLHADYLHHFEPLSGRRDLPFRLPLYVGVGPLLAAGERHREDGWPVNLNLRFPLGAELALKRVPIGIFAEIAPGIRLLPETEFRLYGGLGARFYF